MRAIALSEARSRGMTLIELVAAIVILGIALTGITIAVYRGVGQSADVMTQTRAVALAQSYLQEITGRRFDENSNPRGIPPCWTDAPGLADCTAVSNFGSTINEPNEDARPQYDDVDDYHGVNEGWNSTDGEPLRDADGIEREGYDNFRIEVSVRYIQPGEDGLEEFLGVNLGHPEDAKFITVTVFHPDQPDGWDFSVYKANF